jgi:hypothetical protein
MESDRSAARDFLESVETYLRQKIAEAADPKKIREDIEQVVAQAKISEKDRHLAFPEGAFLNRYAVPFIHDYLVNHLKLSEGDACSALLSESYKHLPGVASGSPASKEEHPFTKDIGEGVDAVAARWWDASKPSAVAQACPDLALRNPFKIVFEGKYFRNGSARVARADLVKDVYQSFFYLGLPKVQPDNRHAVWDYEYACLLAYDASRERTLADAWSTIRPDVRSGLWDGANIYVMVL